MEEFEAVVEETVFRNEENGYSVLQVRVGRTRTSAVGVLPALGAGERLKIRGEWVDHSVYGRQIKVVSCEVIQPTTLDGIEKYLASAWCTAWARRRRASSCSTSASRRSTCSRRSRSG